jgi:tetratricopeptide (TPR) repeat protein
MQIGKWEEALDDAEHLTRAAPDNILAWGAKGYALCRLGDAARALEPLDKACELGKRRFRRAPVYRAAALITLGRPAAAVEDSRAYLDRHKGDALGWFMQGLAEAHGARWEAALDCCKEALNADKGHHATWKLEGAVLQRMGRYHLALRSFEEAMELDGGDAETWLGRGAALSKLGKHEESVAAYGKAIQLGVGDPRLFAACAAGLLRIERWEEAAGLLGRGLRGMGPREPNAVHAACQCMSAMLACARDAAGWRGRLRDLVETYEAAERLDELGVGLAASVAGLEGAGDEKREAWRAFWADESQRFRALTLPNRLVDAAVRYLQSRDVRTLLALTQEERRLVTRLLTETGGEP